MKTTLALFDQLNSMFNSNKNFESCIAMQGFTLDKDIKEELKILKNEKKHSQALIRMCEFTYCYTAFDAKAHKLLSNIIQIIHENLDLLVEDYIKSRYLSEQIEKFSILNANIKGMKGYEWNKKGLTNLFKLIIPIFSIEEPEGDMILPNEILQEMAQIGKQASQIKDENIIDCIDAVSKDDFCGFFLHNFSILIKDCANQIIDSYSKLLEGSYDIDRTEFPRIIKRTKNTTEKQKNTKPDLYLIDIWKVGADGKKKEYEKTISLLLQENYDIQSPFLTKEKDKLIWNEKPKKGWVQYLAAFIYVCIQNKWIANKYSGPELKGILMRTFNIEEFDVKPLKSLEMNVPSTKYLKAFSHFPKNE